MRAHLHNCTHIKSATTTTVLLQLCALTLYLPYLNASDWVEHNLKPKFRQLARRLAHSPDRCHLDLDLNIRLPGATRCSWNDFFNASLLCCRSVGFRTNFITLWAGVWNSRLFSTGGFDEEELAWVVSVEEQCLGRIRDQAEVGLLAAMLPPGGAVE